MDRIRNPYSPGAGAPPPELVGRAAILEQATTLLGRVLRKRAEKSILLTGLRGVGKTVLLNEILWIAQGQGYRTCKIEAIEDRSLGTLIAPKLREIFYDLDRLAGLGIKVKRGLRVLGSFLSALRVTHNEITYGLDLDTERGTADSGDLEVDLPALLVALGEAADERETGVALFIDEIQYFSSKELSALIMAMHEIQQRQLPVVLVGAGLPILPALAGNSKSYAERLFHFPIVGALSQEESSIALQDPARKEGAAFTVEALDEVYRKTQGYPYFIQEWGYQIWNHAEESPFTLNDALSANTAVEERLDASFFRVRFDRLTAGEKRFLRMMAELGPGPYRISDVAGILGVKVTSLGPVRAKLIRKGMIYSPAFGDIAFSVPLFDAFMKRAMPHATNDDTFR
ncbi:MAG: ATP-binding protein [Bradyrhizobiaceae bacterium]|nr:ATP-binding protein [Bradyrhizobiaceae bacterium]